MAHRDGPRRAPEWWSLESATKPGRASVQGLVSRASLLLKDVCNQFLYGPRVLPDSVQQSFQRSGGAANYINRARRRQVDLPPSIIGKPAQRHQAADHLCGAGSSTPVSANTLQLPSCCLPQTVRYLPVAITPAVGLLLSASCQVPTLNAMSPPRATLIFTGRHLRMRSLFQRFSSRARMAALSAMGPPAAMSVASSAKNESHPSSPLAARAVSKSASALRIACSSCCERPTANAQPIKRLTITSGASHESLISFLFSIT